MKCSPFTAQLYSLRDKAFTWQKCISELVDNSLDAGSKTVELGWDKGNVFYIYDHGDGIQPTADKMKCLFTIGEHVPHARKRGKLSGQFGVGFKDATGWLWGKTTVTSYHRGLMGRVEVNWERWAKSQSWELDDPSIQQSQRHSGLTVRCSQIERSAPTEKQMGSLVRDLSFMFYPAISDGVKIVSTLNGSKSQWGTYPIPERTDVILRDISVKGKKISIDVGIVPSEIPNPKSGLNYYRAHRLIKAGSVLGCGQANVSRIFGMIRLDRDWRISPDKSEIVDPHIDDMSEAIENVIRPLLDKAGKMAEVIAIKNIETELSMLLTSSITARPNNTGDDVAPEKDKEYSEDEEKKSPSRREKKRPRVPSSRDLTSSIRRGGVRVMIVDDPESEKPGIGWVESQPLVVKLNKANDQVKRVLALKKYHDVLGGAHQLAVSLLAFYMATKVGEDEKGYMPDEVFSLRLGEYLGLLTNGE